MSTKTQLRAALDSLQVKRPLKLPTGRPSFQAPQVPPPTEDQKPTPVPQATHLEVSPPVSKPTQVQKESQVSNNAKVLPRRATEQDSSVILEHQASEKLGRGYTRIPNTLLLKMTVGDFTKNEIKLILIIARFTISYQREMAPLSKNVLERLTGIQGGAILEALSSLSSKGVLKKEKGDQNRPNQLGLILEKGWDQPEDGKRTPVPDASFPAVENSTQGRVRNPTPFKDNKKYLNINSLSELPDLLKEYFVELKPQSKRESEWRFFEELRRDFSLDEIASCVEHLRREGIGEKHEDCHSPMAYLSKAITSVIEQIRGQRERAAMRLANERHAAEIAHAKAQEEAKAARDWRIKEQAFNRAFPGKEVQHEAITELCRSTLYRPHTPAGRCAAIEKWWDGLKTSERLELSS